ncbi:MAG: RNA polymerase sigma factor [Ignavibacteria bacterium]|nr:RNA polymerase sigma factor [Ignavibacteria bacterium]
MDTQKHNDAIVVALLSGQGLERRDLYEAARILNEEYLPMVYAYLEKWFGLHNPRLLDSIVVETIERVTRSINKYDPSRSKFTTFLIGFARLVACEMLRKELKTICIEEVDETEVLDQTESSNDAKTLLHELLTGRYAACLEILDEKYRVVLEMAIEGEPPERYQQHFDVNRATYRKRKERAIKELRECISMMGAGTLLDNY